VCCKTQSETETRAPQPTVKKLSSCRYCIALLLALQCVCPALTRVTWLQTQLDEVQQRCRSLENAVTHGESEKRDLLEHLSKLVQAVDDRDAKLKEQVMTMLIFATLHG
jgi:uncharacterized protein HemX